MNWTRENKNKKSSQLEILQKARLWWDGISQSKKTKPFIMVSVFVLVGIFIVTIPTAHAVWPPLSWLADSASGAMAAVVSYFLSAVQGLMLLLVAAAGTLFTVVISPANISGANGILNKAPIREVWVMTRDTLNMFFILVLLFSAFCTIFQIEKWGLKKVWLSILVNALLVNFSYPIARFIIDISNVALYYFVNNMFTSPSGTVTGNSIFSDFGTVLHLGDILTPDHFADQGLLMQIVMIIFTFILAITLLVIAILFLVRLMALAILIMFSPIGFVGYIFPATASFADKWWKQLLSYSFFAPIMMFGIAVSLKVAQSINDENANAILGAASANVSTGVGIDANWLARLAFFAIPIVILWMFMGVAKSMGIAGAEAVVGGAQKFAKGAGKKFSGYNWAKKNVDAYKASRQERDKEMNKNRFGGRLADNVNDKLDRTGAAYNPTEKGRADAQKRHDKRKHAKNKAEINDKMENHNGDTEATLHANIQKMNISSLKDEELMDAAGQIKQALSRGSAYEKVIEGDLKKHSSGHVGLTGVAKPPAYLAPNIQALKTMSEGERAAEKAREKQMKEALDDWVRSEKTAHMDKNRDIVKKAEKQGQLK